MTLDVYTAIDLDRTTLKSTSLLYNYIVPAIQATYGYDDSVIKEVFEKEKLSRGRAFDFIDYINQLAARDGLKPVSIENLASVVVDHERDADKHIKPEFIDNIFVEHTLELIHVITNRKGEEWGFMTSGGDHTQNLKLGIARPIIKEHLGISPRAEVIATESKAETIMSEWYDAEFDAFRLPDAIDREGLLFARRVRLLDDKPSNTTVPPEFIEASRGRFEAFRMQPAEQPEDGGMTIAQIIEKIQ